MGDWLEVVWQVSKTVLPTGRSLYVAIVADSVGQIDYKVAYAGWRQLTIVSGKLRRESAITPQGEYRIDESLAGFTIITEKKKRTA